MAKLAVIRARSAGRGSLANHNAIFRPLAFQDCSSLVVLIVGDLRALVGSMFLDISVVSGPIFLKPTLFLIVKYTVGHKDVFFKIQY